MAEAQPGRVIMSTEDLGHGLTEPMRLALQEHNAQEREKQKTCAHAGYSFAQHGRCCPHCGTIMMDFGD